MKANTSLTAVLTTAVFAVLGAPTFAQVEVVESNNRLISTPQQGVTQAATQTAATSGNPQAEMFYQLQTLQQEVSQLRGLVEEQAYELKRLKQQRLDDYLNLDRRLSALGNGASAAKGNGAGATSGQDSNKDSGTSPVSTTAVAPNEVQRYRTAIDLVLRKKDYAQAITAFNQYLTDFPEGRYAPNSQYWLGEIYLLQGNLEKSREWFARLLNDNSDHAKAQDATYKLGTVYHKLGDDQKAQQLLQQVAAGSSNAARLAASYLTEMGQ